uniref:Potassium/proton antiporter CemA n=1 Tax=Vanilla planifolia TaxID=51239 RepID=A0A0D3M9S5_VANPL|nr:envelope membrane protein [Vanilla planifolia]AID52161.1 envelope membrane protein [Vanilla planifolia]QII90233.1 envelope membrane carbon uptake protein [Vanilla planifolia]
MKKKNASAFIPYLVSIFFWPWFISLSLNKGLETWILHWWNTGQSEILLNDIEEENVLEKFMEFEELFLLDEMIKDYSETHIQRLRIGMHNETIQLVKRHNESNFHIILHFSTNLICFTILSGYFFLDNKELFILNSRIQEFLYNLSDTIKAFLIIFVVDLCFGFHSTRGWELMIRSIYNDFGLAQNEQIISLLVSIFPVILDVIVKYGIFHFLNRVSPSLVIIYHSMNE